MNLSEMDWSWLPMLLIGAVALFFVVLIVYAIARGVANLQAPQERLRAVVRGKRQEVRGGGGNTSVHMHHYITFEFEGGARKEISVHSGDFGTIFEGDTGFVTMQGTWYRGFQRTTRDLG